MSQALPILYVSGPPNFMLQVRSDPTTVQTNGKARRTHGHYWRKPDDTAVAFSS
jgi:hypothetical protein